MKLTLYRGVRDYHQTKTVGTGMWFSTSKNVARSYSNNIITKTINSDNVLNDTTYIMGASVDFASGGDKYDFSGSVADTGGVERCHIPQDIICRIDQVECQSGSGAFSDAHIQLQQRIFAKSFKKIAMACFR